MSLLKRLISLANGLDNRNFFDEASHIDNIIVRLAMSMEDARALLGVSSTATDEEIQKAWRAKAIEHHPDRGGDEEMMKNINVARDLLVGERMPMPSRPPGPSSRPTPWEPPKKEDKMYVDKETGTPFEEAVEQAKVPAGIAWKFVTDTGFGNHGFDTNVHGFVAYGITDNEHVFVGVYNKREINAFSHKNINDYKVWTATAPKSASLADIAPRIIRELWNKFVDVKQYNAKVKLLDENATLSPHMRGERSVSFKDAMSLLGETPTTYNPNKKVDIVIELGYPPKEAGPLDYSVILVVNGRPYKLSDENSARISKMRKLLGMIFGSYYYADSKKNITRQSAEKRKVVLNFLAEKLANSEPPELIESLKKGAEQ